MSLSVASNHKPGRVLAYKLMCMMTVRRHDKKLSSEHLAHFYRLLHDGLTGSDQVNPVLVMVLSSSKNLTHEELPPLSWNLIFNGLGLQ